MEWSLTQNKLLAYHRLMRTDKPIGALLLLWPTLWALWVATPGCRRCGSWRVCRRCLADACGRLRGQ
jgi:4-hydroxybenzoate polyprenyltransferase